MKSPFANNRISNWNCIKKKKSLKFFSIYKMNGKNENEYRFNAECKTVILIENKSGNGSQHKNWKITYFS